MLRGMDNFGHGEDDGESESSTVGNIVSVNHPTDVGIIPDRRESRDTDTESFTYEHFPVVCPTCRGVGQVHEDDVNELVSFVPVKDKRLQPSRIFWKLVIMLFICACIATPVAFFLIPRSVSISLKYDISSKIYIPDNKTLNPYIIVKSTLSVTNNNYLEVKLTDIDVQVSWNKILLNSGTCIQHITLTVPSRKSLKKSLETKINFNGVKHGTAGYLFRHHCANGFHNHIFVKFATRANVTFLTQDSQISDTEYPYIQCYNYSGIGNRLRSPQRR